MRTLLELLEEQNHFFLCCLDFAGTWRIQYPAMSTFEGASMPYSDQVKENSESMGKEGEKMVKEK